MLQARRVGKQTGDNHNHFVAVLDDDFGALIGHRCEVLPRWPCPNGQA